MSGGFEATVMILVTFTMAYSGKHAKIWESDYGLTRWQVCTCL